MKTIAISVICLMMFFALQLFSCAAEADAPGFGESAAHTGDVMTMLSVVALAAIMAFVTFIAVMRIKRNKDPHE